MKKLFANKILLVVAALVVVGGGAGAFFMLRPKAEAKGADGHEAEQAHETEGEAGVYDLDVFLVNLNDPKGDRYMKVAIKLAVQPAEAVEELRDNELARARMRDRILTLLSSKTYDELSTPLGKEGLRRELQAQLESLVADASPNAKHGKPSIQDVLFSDFVVQ